MAEESKYVTLLVPTRPLSQHCWRLLKYPDGSCSAMSDASYLQYLAEEFVRLGAINIAVDRHSSLFGSVNNLPSALKFRIKTIDKRDLATRKVISILRPVLTELNITIKSPPIVAETSETGIDQVCAHVQRLATDLRHFVVGLDYQLQIDVNIEDMKESIDYLLECCRANDSRANLATIYGILSTYKVKEVESVEIKSTAPEQLIKVFREFIEDQTYRMLSEQARFLGFPTFFSKTQTILGRLARKLIEKPAFREVLDIGSRSISTVTKLPVPDSKLAVSLLQKEYMPPVISLDSAIRKARDMWWEIEPQFIPFDDDRHHITSDSEIGPPLELSQEPDEAGELRYIFKTKY